MSRLEKQSVGWVAIAVALAFPLSLCVHFGTGVFPESTRLARSGTATSGNEFLGVSEFAGFRDIGSDFPKEEHLARLRKNRFGLI